MYPGDISWWNKMRPFFGMAALRLGNHAAQCTGMGIDKP